MQLATFYPSVPLPLLHTPLSIKTHMTRQAISKSSAVHGSERSSLGKHFLQDEKYVEIEASGRKFAN